MMQSPQPRRRWRRTLLYIASGVAVVALIIFVVNNRLAQWTGIGDKTLWDWMSLLIIPSALTGLGLSFNRADRANEQRLADERRESEQEIATDNLRESTLQTFIDRMSELLLDKALRTSTEDTEIRHIARARTLTAIRQLDSTHKGILLQFLYESELIGQNKQQPVILLKGMDFTETNLHRATLRGATLREANLQKANS